MLAVLAVGDLTLRGWLESRIADAVEQRLAGVRVDDVAVDGFPVAASLVDRAVDVRLDVVVPFALLAERTADRPGLGDREVTWSASAGRLVASVEIERAGLPVEVGVAFDVRADGGDVVLEPTTVLAAGLQVPVARVRQGLSERLGGLLETRVVDLDALVDVPAELEAVAVETDGLRFELAATDVPLDGRAAATS